jgi:DNA repair protein RadC
MGRVGKVKDGAQQAPREAAGNGSVGAEEAAAEGPRERLARLGAPALTDSELLAVLFASGTRQLPVHVLAEQLVAQGGGLRALAQCDALELCAHRGLGPARAAQVLAALELGRRVQTARERRPRLPTPRDIYLYLAPRLAALQREVFHVLCFNGRNVLLADARVAEGSWNTCPVEPREVFRTALTARAVGIVVAHNHPSGDPEPSSQDRAITRHLQRGAELLGLKLLDHLVLGEGSYVSMAERGWLGRQEGCAACEGGRGCSGG